MNPEPDVRSSVAVNVELCTHPLHLTPDQDSPLKVIEISRQSSKLWVKLGWGHGTKNITQGYFHFMLCPNKDAKKKKSERLQGPLLGCGWDHAVCSGYNSATNYACDCPWQLESPVVLVSNSMATCDPWFLTDDRNYPYSGGFWQNAKKKPPFLDVRLNNIVNFYHRHWGQIFS